MADLVYAGLFDVSLHLRLVEESDARGRLVRREHLFARPSTDRPSAYSEPIGETLSPRVLLGSFPVCDFVGFCRLAAIFVFHPLYGGGSKGWIVELARVPTTVLATRTCS